MKTWKKRLVWPLMAIAVSLALSQAAFAGGEGDDDDDDDDDIVAVPEGGATALMLAGACFAVEALRRKMKR